jgi:putative endonuclease
MDKTEVGRRGEDAAAAYCERIGMTVAARNWRCPLGEIDIVAWDGDTLALIEVKTRRTERTGSPEDAVSVNKQRRLARLTEAFLAGGGRVPLAVRFDVIAIRVLGEGRALLRHHRGAFEVGP